MDAQPYPLPRATRETEILAGDGGATYGPFDFKIFDLQDLQAFVKHQDGDWQAAEFTAAKVAGNEFDDFTITFAEALAPTSRYIVQSSRLHERQVAITQGGAIGGRPLEKELSKQGSVIEELRRDIWRGGSVMPVEPGRVLIVGDDRRMRPGPLAEDIEHAQVYAAMADASADVAMGAASDANDAKLAAESAAGANLSNADSVAAAELTTIPGAVNYIRTAGYASPGDGGGALYKRVAVEPDHPGKFQSADGGWWEISAEDFSVELNQLSSKIAVENEFHPVVAPQYISTAGLTSSEDMRGSTFLRGDLRPGRNIVAGIPAVNYAGNWDISGSTATAVPTGDGSSNTLQFAPASLIPGRKYRIRFNWSRVVGNTGRLRAAFSVGGSTAFSPFQNVPGETDVVLVPNAGNGGFRIVAEASFSGAVDLASIRVQEMPSERDDNLLTLTLAGGQIVRYHDPLQDDYYVEVPTEYPTWLAAADALSRKNLRMGKKVFLVTRRDHEPSEGFFADGGDFGRFVIIRDGPGEITVADDFAAGIDLDNSPEWEGCIVWMRYGKAPELASPVNMRNRGKRGYSIQEGSTGFVHPGCGIRNAGSLAFTNAAGLYVHSSTIKASDTDWSGCAAIGCWITRGASGNIEGAIADDCDSRGFYISRASNIALANAKARRCGVGIRALRSIVDARDGEFTHSIVSSHGIGMGAQAGQGSVLILTGSLIEGCEVNGVESFDASNLSFRNGTSRNNGGRDLRVVFGGMIDARSAITTGDPGYVGPRLQDTNVSAFNQYMENGDGIITANIV